MKRENLKRIIIVLFVFLCTAVFTFMYLLTSRDNRYTRNLDLGNKYLLSEDYDGAIRAFTKAIEIDEKKEDAYIGRGDAYKAKGDYANAWEDYEKAEELSGDTNLIRDKIGATEIAVVDANGQGIDGANVELKGDSHSYEFVTDDTGRIAEPIYPEKYKVKVVKDEYEPVETELSAEEGGFVADPIKLGSGVGAEQGAIPKVYKEAVSDFDKLMREGQKSYREKNKDTYEEEDRDTYYTIVDIDGNGVDELILRFDHRDGKHLTNKDSGYGESTYIYTVKDGKAVNVLVPESSSQGFTPDFVHLGFTKIYKGTNLINRGYEHLPMDDAFYSYQDGVLSETPVAELTRGGGTWLINGETKTEEECEEAYNRLSNGDEGYELQLYEGETNTSEQDSGTADLIEKYKNFIQSKNNSYRIYDIDKDGFPELFFSEMHYEDREAFCDIYTYKEGEFILLDRTYGFIFWQEFPIYASYPNGNGIVQYDWGKGREIVTVETWNEGVNESETVYFTDYLKDNTKEEQVYYKDTNDEAYETEINHQFYQSGTSNPFFEGSNLLAYNAMDNYTALYEAFGVEDEKSETEDLKNTFAGCIKLTEGIVNELDLNNNGKLDSLSYTVNWVGDDHVKSFVLNVNDNSLTVENEFLPMYSFVVDSVYAADLDTSDGYKNLICQISYYTYIYAYDDTTIQRVEAFHGIFIPNSTDGKGCYDAYLNGVVTDENGNIMCQINTFEIENLTQRLFNNKIGKYDGESIESYKDGFEIVLKKEHATYKDKEGSEANGSIPAGERVSVIDFYDRGPRPMLYMYKVSSNSGEVWITDLIEY